MADLTDANSSQTIKLVGADNTGLENNYAQVTAIGQVLVQAEISSGAQTISPKLVYEDMNASTGGAARGTIIVGNAAWTKIYEYTGSGSFVGWRTTIESVPGTASDYWLIRFVIDTNEIFTANGINVSDMYNNDIYNLDATPSANTNLNWCGLTTIRDTIALDTPSELAIAFTSNVKIYVKRVGNLNKAWRAGLVCIVKDT